MNDNNSEDSVYRLEQELSESKALLNELHKANQVREILTSKGFTPAQIKEALPIIEAHVARGVDGGLEGVDPALAYLAKTRPDLTTQKVAQYKPVNVPPARGYQAPSDGDEKQARKIFGPSSNAMAAQAMATEHPAEYRRLKSVARTLQIVA
jgi:hypothetical protein